LLISEAILQQIIQKVELAVWDDVGTFLTFSGAGSRPSSKASAFHP
jgi:hypothetical protein